MKGNTKYLVQEALKLLLMIVILSFTTNAQTTSQKGIPEGYSLIDGDILMPTSFVESVLQGIMPDATYRTNLWTNGIVRFEFDANVTAANQTLMLNAMAVLENVANVDFQQCGGNCNTGNYAHVQNSTANNSQVGMLGGQQIININGWGTQFIIVHELLHCLGFYHEHVRPDRNIFIQINCNPAPQTCNIQGGFGGALYNNNFVIPGDASVYGTYDFDSVMHYDQCGFSTDCPAGQTCTCTNTVFTILGTVPPGVIVGQRTHLSALDQATVSFLYPFAGVRFLDCTYNGSNGPSNGTFRQPYTTLATALANTPAGGTSWVLNNCSFPAGTYSNQVTIRSAPNVTATFGS